MQEHTTASSSAPRIDRVMSQALVDNGPNTVRALKSPVMKETRANHSEASLATPQQVRKLSKLLKSSHQEPELAKASQASGASAVLLSQLPSTTVVASASLEVNLPVLRVPAVDTVPSTSCNIDDIRAARVRRFQTDTAAPLTIKIPTPINEPRTSPNRDVQSSFRVPVGAECIDLTDD